MCVHDVNAHNDLNNLSEGAASTMGLVSTFNLSIVFVRAMNMKRSRMSVIGGTSAALIILMPKLNSSVRTVGTNVLRVKSMFYVGGYSHSNTSHLGIRVRVVLSLNRTRG